MSDIFWEVIKDIDITSFVDTGTGTNGVVGMQLEIKEGGNKKHNIYQKHKCGWKYEEILGFKTGKNDSENMWKDTNM